MGNATDRDAMIGRIRERVSKPWKMIELYRNWLLALLDRLHLVGQRPVLYQLRNGVKFSLEAGTLDVRIINEIWIDQIYTRWPGFSIRDGWTVADLGGQKGIFSVLAATSAKDVKVYTFEPAPENFASLRQNLELNALSNVKSFNLAVGSEDGEAILHLAAESGCNSLIQRSDVTKRGDVRVETWSMGKVLRALPTPVNLLKMDIEGMEYDALLSCSAEDLERVERIALECHGDHIDTGHSNSELIRFLEERGFSTHHPERCILLAARTPSPALQFDPAVVASALQ